MLHQQLIDDINSVDFNEYLNSIDNFDDDTINILFNNFIINNNFNHLRYLVSKRKNNININSFDVKVFDDITFNNNTIKIISFLHSNFEINIDDIIVMDYIKTDKFIENIKYLDEVYNMLPLLKNLNLKYNIVYILNKIYIKFKISSDFDKFINYFN